MYAIENEPHSAAAAAIFVYHLK